MHDDIGDGTIRSVIEITFTDPAVIELKADTAVIDVEATIEVEAEVSYMDADTAVYDPEGRLLHWEAIETFANGIVEANVAFEVTYAKDTPDAFTVRGVDIDGGSAPFLDTWAL